MAFEKGLRISTGLLEFEGGVYREELGLESVSYF